MVICPVVMMLIMAGVAMLAVIGAKKQNTPINRSLSSFTLFILGYHLFAFSQYYFRENSDWGFVVKMTGCLADICFFAFIVSWLLILAELSDYKSIVSKRMLVAVTAVYGCAAELIVFFAGDFNDAARVVTVGMSAGQTMLVLLNGAYGVWILMLGIRYFIFSFRKMEKSYKKKQMLFFSGMLVLYMAWIIVQDYDFVCRSDNMVTSAIIVDPLLLICSVLDLAVIYFFFKKDPLELFSRQSLQQKEKMQLVIERKKLTKKESEVLELVCEGLNNPGIAEVLCISENTVKRHLNNIFQKTGAANRYELISLVWDQ